MIPWTEDDLWMLKVAIPLALLLGGAIWWCRGCQSKPGPVSGNVRIDQQGRIACTQYDGKKWVDMPCGSTDCGCSSYVGTGHCSCTPDGSARIEGAYIETCNGIVTRAGANELSKELAKCPKDSPCTVYVKPQESRVVKLRPPVH